MKARRWRINKNCKWTQMKTFSELAECLAQIPPKITLYGLIFKYNYVGCILLLMFSSDLLFAIKRDAYIFKETGWVCRFPKHQKLDKWTIAGEKRQNVGPNFTLKPSTKARSLQFCKTEIKTDIGGEKKRNKRRIYGLLVNGRDLRHYSKQVKSRAGERFIYETHSFMSVSFYTYLCIYVCLHLQPPLDHINSVALERIVRGTLEELSKNLMISLSLRNN